MAAGFSLVAGGGQRAVDRPSGEDGARRRPGIDPPSFGDGDDGWVRPGDLPAPAGPTLSEWFAGGPQDSGWAGLLLHGLARDRPLLWVQERMAILETGRVHPPGMAYPGGHPGLIHGIIPDLIHVEARDARDALWAMEEGLRCPALGAVIGELWGDPASLDFTATRRLAVAAERHGVAAFLIRLGGHANLSGARFRWRIASAPGLPHPFNPRAPGPPAWTADLFRARGATPGTWQVTHEPADEGGAADRVGVAAAPGDRAVAAAGGR